MGMGPQSGLHCCNNYDMRKTSKKVDYFICQGQYVQNFAVKKLTYSWEN